MIIVSRSCSVARFVARSVSCKNDDLVSLLTRLGLDADVLGGSALDELVLVEGLGAALVLGAAALVAVQGQRA